MLQTTPPPLAGDDGRQKMSEDLLSAADLDTWSERPEAVDDGSGELKPEIHQNRTRTRGFVNRGQEGQASTMTVLSQPAVTPAGTDTTGVESTKSTAAPPVVIRNREPITVKLNNTEVAPSTAEPHAAAATKTNTGATTNSNKAPPSKARVNVTVGILPQGFGRRNLSSTGTPDVNGSLAFNSTRSAYLPGDVGADRITPEKSLSPWVPVAIVWAILITGLCIVCFIRKHRKKNKRYMEAKIDESLRVRLSQEQDMLLMRRVSAPAVTSQDMIKPRAVPNLRMETFPVHSASPPIPDVEEEMAEEETDPMLAKDKGNVLSEGEPVISEREPVISEGEPVISEGEPVISEGEPVISERETVISEAEPGLTQAEPPTSKEGQIMPQVEQVITKDEQMVSHAEPVIYKEDQELSEQIPPAPKAEKRQRLTQNDSVDGAVSDPRRLSGHAPLRGHVVEEVIEVMYEELGRPARWESFTILSLGIPSYEYRQLRFETDRNDIDLLRKLLKLWGLENTEDSIRRLLVTLRRTFMDLEVERVTERVELLIQTAKNRVI